MLYYLLYPLRDVISGFNVFRYISFRTAWAALTALVISFILGPWLIERMRQIKLGQFIREEGPKSHQQKAGTPTMGGILINIAILIPTLLYYGGGWIQYGYRYFLDSIPFVIALCALAVVKSGSLSWFWRLVILFGVAINLAGVYWAYHI